MAYKLKRMDFGGPPSGTDMWSAGPEFGTEETMYFLSGMDRDAVVAAVNLVSDLADYKGPQSQIELADNPDQLGPFQRRARVILGEA